MRILEDCVRFIDNFRLRLEEAPLEVGSLVLGVLILPPPPTLLLEVVVFLRRGRCGSSLAFKGSSESAGLSKEVTDPIDIELALESRYCNDINLYQVWKQ